MTIRLLRSACGSRPPLSNNAEAIAASVGPTVSMAMPDFSRSGNFSIVKAYPTREK